MSMYLTFFSGVGSVTGANFLLEINNKKILVDCGLIQGDRQAQMENRKDFEYNPKDIDMLFVTHAHLDHVGRIPKLVKEGFVGEIYSTPETKALAELILEDATGLIQRESTREGILPMYEAKDVRKALEQWKTIKYHETRDFRDFSVYLKDAGHILGSSMIEFAVGDKKVLFTGDLGNSPSPLLRDTEVVEGVDYVVMESVYGDRNHEAKEEREEKLESIIKKLLEKKGTLVIPAFSLERTQVILYEINKLVESKAIPAVPTYVDSPLAIKITDIYKGATDLFNDNIKKEIKAGDDVFNFPRLAFTISQEDSKSIDHIHPPKIILAGSGMSVGGRVTHHEEMYLGDKKNTILLVGYQTMGSLGRKILDGSKKVKIYDNEIEVKADIESILGYSSHKDSDHLVDFISTTENTVKKVFVAMGEPKASTFLAQKIRDNTGINAMYPERLKRYQL